MAPSLGFRQHLGQTHHHLDPQLSDTLVRALAIVSDNQLRSVFCRIDFPIELELDKASSLILSYNGHFAKKGRGCKREGEGKELFYFTSELQCWDACLENCAGREGMKYSGLKVEAGGSKRVGAARQWA